MVDLEVWSHRRDSLVKSSSLEQYVQEVKTRLAATACGISKFKDSVTAPPGSMEPHQEDVGYHDAVNQCREIVESMAVETAKKEAARKEAGASA